MELAIILKLLELQGWLIMLMLRYKCSVITSHVGNLQTLETFIANDLPAAQASGTEWHNC